MSDYEIEVTLPSKGIFNKDMPELSGPIRLRMITADDEKVVFGSVADKVTKTLIERCLVSPKFDTDKLLLADRQYLLMQLRIFSYGDDYHLTVGCDACGKKGEVKISLSEDLPLDVLPDDYTPECEIALPVSKKVVTFKQMSVEDMDRAEARARTFAKKTGQAAEEFEYIFNRAYRIQSIDGKTDLDFSDREKFVRSLVGRDSAYLTTKMDSLKLGYSYTVDVKCPNCGEEIQTVFSMTSEFFRPRFD